MSRPGGKARKPSFQRYWSEKRRDLHKRRHVARFEKMVAESRARRAAKRGVA